MQMYQAYNLSLGAVVKWTYVYANETPTQTQFKSNAARKKQSGSKSLSPFQKLKLIYARKIERPI